MQRRHLGFPGEGFAPAAGPLLFDCAFDGASLPPRLARSTSRPTNALSRRCQCVTDATDLEFWTASFDGNIFFSAPSKIDSAVVGITDVADHSWS